jgi:hypothetical protein
MKNRSLIAALLLLFGTETPGSVLTPVKKFSAVRNHRKLTLNCSARPRKDAFQ